MVTIKVCGLQGLKDVEMINPFPIAYAGFIFAKSKRQIPPERAKEAIKKLTHAKSVGVFVNEDIHEMLRIAKFCRLDILQLHGDETQDDILYLRQHTNCTIWKALRIHHTNDIASMTSLQPDRFLLDAYEEGSFGGTGKEINPSLLSNIDLSNVILAGGIHSGNVRSKLALHPYGIDISSGVETNGKKDFAKIRTLMREVMRI